MKHLLKLFFGGIALLAFAQCGSSQTLETKAPFTLDNPAVEPWTAGEEKEHFGVNLLFPVSSGRAYVLDTVYYGNQKAPLMKIEKDNYLVYKATLETSSEKPDMIMHADSRQEAGNRPPKLGKNPFPLEEDEAVISYMDGKTRKYLKVEALKTSTPIHYKERPKLKNRP